MVQVCGCYLEEAGGAIAREVLLADDANLYPMTCDCAGKEGD